MHQIREPRGVLLVDDDRTTLTMYGDFLEKSGFQVYRAISGQDALAQLIKCRTDIDIVVTDILMAKMDGWQFLDYIRKDMRLDEIVLPVIVVSAISSVDLDMEYIRHKANDWLEKPVNPLAILAEKIRTHLGMEPGPGESDEHGN